MRKFHITVNGTTYQVDVEEMEADTAAPVTPVAPKVAPVAPTSAPKTVSAPKVAATAPAGAEVINAPMPGNILKVNVKTGDAVKKGDVLVVLEAMKMENDIQAAHDGTVAAVHVSQGQTVETGEPLVSLS